MDYRFDRCDYCGVWHQIKVVQWGGVDISTCPRIPIDLCVLIADEIPCDPDQDNPLSTAFRGSA